MGVTLDYLRQWVPMLRRGKTQPTDAAILALTEHIQALEDAAAPFGNLILPKIYGDGLGGCRMEWRNGGGVITLCANEAGVCEAYRIDTGAEPATVETLDPTNALRAAFNWLANSDTMLIIPARLVHPMTAEVAPFSGTLPKVSVVVACYGALDLTKNLVKSLEANAGCEYDLLLMDDCCPEETWKWAAAEGIPCIRHRLNQGLPRTINEGAAAVDGELLALWNSDMLCQPNGLKRLAEAAMVHGIAAQTGGWFLPGGTYGGNTNDVWRSDYPEGYCLVTRRDVWNDVGEWDPIYHPSNCDDSDWSLRARLKGYHFTLVPNAVIHFGGQSTGSLPPGYVQRNQEVLRKRYAHMGLGDRILVRRWGAHGDLMMTTPALRALKRQSPLAHIHVQCHDHAGKVLLGLPYVDGVFTSVPAGIHYTRSINLNGVYELQQQNGIYEHPANAFCRVAEVEYDGKPYDFSISARSIRQAADLLPYHGRLIACGLRSANRPKQNMTVRNWLKLADLLPDGWKLVALDSEPQPFIGSHGPSPDDALFYSHPKVVDLTGQTKSLHEAGTIISLCDAFVGVDSGLLHVAHSQSLPVVNLCAAAPEAARTPLTGDRLAFEGKAACFPCQFPERCPHDTHCLDYVQPADIVTWLKGIM